MTLDSIHWIFQTGIPPTANISNPTTVFNSPGIYSVQLDFIDEFGCFDSEIKYIEIDALPIPDFSVEDICALDTAYFYNTSQIGTNNFHPVSPWQWIFGDGYTLTDSNPSYNFQNLFHHLII